MLQIKKMWGVLLLCTAMNLPVNAQNLLEILDAQIVLESEDMTGLDQFTEEELEDMDEDVLDSIFANRNYDVTIAIQVSDTSLVQTIHLRLGRTQGTTDLVDISVPFDGALPANIQALLKDDDELQVELGSHSNTSTLYLEVWLDDRNGQSTAVLQTSNL